MNRLRVNNIRMLVVSNIAINIGSCLGVSGRREGSYKASYKWQFLDSGGRWELLFYFGSQGGVNG